MLLNGPNNVTIITLSGITSQRKRRRLRKMRLRYEALINNYS